MYTAQLSDATGSFAAPVAVGTLTSTANSGTIAVTLPAGATTGTNYRIRVISSNPAAIGTDNGINFTITAPAIASFSYTGTPFCQNVTNPSPTFSGGGVAGTFSSTTGLNFVSTSTGVVNLATSTAGTYTVTNTIAASGGCPLVSATSTITITAPAVATFSYTGSPFCQSGTNPSPTFSGGGVAGTFSSTTGLNFVSTSTGVINLATSTAGPYTITNTLPAANGCPIASASTSITIVPEVTPTFAAIGPLCINSTAAALPASSTNSPAITGTWSPTTINTATAGTTTYTFTPTAGQCATTTTLDVQVTASITPTFAAIGPFCVGTTATTLPGSSTNSPVITGVWSPATISTAAAGTTTYTFTPAAGQCAATTTVDVIVTPPNITPTFAAIGPLCIASAAPTLPASSTNSPAITGTWSPASISTATAGTTTYTFTPAAGQCATTATLDIEITSAITPTFAAIGPLCINSTAPALPASSTNSPAITGTWSPATISTTAIGTTTYTFTASAGQCAANTTLDVVITNSITPTFAAIAPLCQGSTAPSLPSTSTNTPAITGTWSPATINTATIGTTTYNFTPDAGQCSAITSIDIEIVPTPPAPAITIVSSTTTICSGQSVDFTATPNSTNTGDVIQWFVNGVPVTGATGLLFSSNTLTNNAQITAVFTPSSSCLAGQTATSNVVLITVNPSTAASISINASNTQICAGTAITFNATANGGGATPQITWMVNGNAVAGATGTTFTSSTLSNSDVVTAMLTSTLPCVSPSTATSAGISIIVLPSGLPTIIISADRSIICVGQAVQFTALSTLGGGAPQFNWQVDGTTVQTNSTGTFTALNLSATSTVTCVLNSNYQCATTANVTSNVITIQVNPVPTVDLSADVTIEEGESTTLIATTGAGLNYVWTPSESLSCSDCLSPVATPEMTTIYSFTVSDPASSCAANDSVKVTVIRNFDIWVPSAFSPNADGHNDLFKVRGNNIKEFTITIYDRWGMKLYESSNLNEAWDGEFNGRKINSGIVVYALTYVLNDGTSETKKGNITISN